MVTGQIKINAQNPTVRLVANSTGNLLLLSHKAQEEVKKGEYIAVVQNPASTEDVRKIADLIDRVDFEGTHLLILKDTFPDKVYLGEINPQYYAFLAALKAQCDYLQQNVYEKQRENITTGIEWKKKIVQEAEDSRKAAKDRMEVARKWLKRYVSLDQQEIATYEYETDQIKNNYLTTVQEVQFQKCGSTSGKLLHNKSLSSEKSAPDSLLKEHGQIHAGYSSKKCRFLHDQILSRYNIKRPD